MCVSSSTRLERLIRKMHISICVSSYKRPAMLRKLLGELRRLETRDRFTFSVVVSDNDPEESGRPVVEDVSSDYPVRIEYVTEPRRNISYARNASLARATGEAIAFIDDDEWPQPDWLVNHVSALQRPGVAGVPGPVAPPPITLRPKSSGPTARALIVLSPRPEFRTGNVLSSGRY